MKSACLIGALYLSISADSARAKHSTSTDHACRQGAVGLPEVEPSLQTRNGKFLPAQPSKIVTLTNVGNSAASWGVKKFQKTRQRVPFFNWLVKYGVPMASATLFTLDIVRFQDHIFPLECM
jgi:hypothetical protein